MSTRHLSNWTRNLIIVLVMLGLWISVTIGVVWMAGDVTASERRVDHTYWLAAYGAPLFYLLLVGLYALLMRSRRTNR